MGAESLLLYLRGHSRNLVAYAVLATLVIGVALLAYAAILAGATAGSSPVDVGPVGPFRWAPIGSGMG